MATGPPLARSAVAVASASGRGLAVNWLELQDIFQFFLSGETHGVACHDEPDVHEKVREL